MSLKDSLERLKTTKEGLKREMQDTRQLVREIRPRPLRNVIDRKMTEVRPFKRLRRGLSERLEPTPRSEEAKTDG